MCRVIRFVERYCLLGLRHSSRVEYDALFILLGHVRELVLRVFARACTLIDSLCAEEAKIANDS